MNILPPQTNRSSTRKPSRPARFRPSLRTSLFAASVAGLFALHGTAHAQSWINTTGAGSWNTGANWSTGTVPTISTFPVFNLAGNNVNETVTLDGAAAASTITFNNTGTTTIIGSTAGTTNYVLTLGSALTINAGAGAVSVGGGNMTLVTVGSSTFTNNSSNLFTLSGPISVGTSTSASQLGIQGSGDTLISGVIGNSTNATPTAGSLVKAGTGTLTLTGANTYTSTTSVNGGILRIDNNAGGSLATTAQTNLGGGTLALLGKAGGTTTQTLGTVVLSTGTTSGISVDGGTSTSTALNFTTFTQNAGSSLNITTANGGVVSTTQANANGIIGSHVILNGTDFAVGNGAGNAVTAVAATALPTTGGTAAANYMATDSYTQAGAVVGNSLKIATTQGGQSFAQAGNTLTLTSGGLLFTGTNDYTISGGTIRGTGTTELVANQYSTGNVTISSIVAGGVFTKAGPGALTLSGNNTNTGADYAGGGTLTLSGDNSAATGGVLLSGGATLNVNSATALGTGTFNVNQNNSVVLPTLNNTSGSAVALTTANPATLTGSFIFGTSTGTASNNLTLGSGLATETSNVVVTLNGADALAFGGALTPGTMSRSLTVNNGTGTTSATAVGFNGITLGVGNTAVQTLTLTGNGAINVTGAITNGTNFANGLTYSGTGALTIAGSTNTYSGGLTINGGTVNLNNATAPGVGVLTISGGTIDNTSGSAVTVTSNSSVAIGNSFAFSTAAGTAANNLTIPGAVALPANRVITLNGAGALTFSGTLTNTVPASPGVDGNRNVTVNNGAGTTSTTALNLGGLALTGTGSTAARTVFFPGSSNVNITGAVTDGVSAGSGLSNNGTGRLTLSNATGNTYTGATTINGLNGALVVSNTSGSATGTGAVALGSATANSPATLASGAGNVGIITGTVTTTSKTTASISPGGAGTVGMLTLTNLMATGGSAFAFDLGATSAASDRLTLTGALAAPTAANSTNLLFNFTNLGATPGTTYTLVTYNSATNLDLGDLSATGATGTFSSTSLTGPGEIDFTITAVPEPSTWIVGLLAIVAFLARGWRVSRARSARP